MADLVERLREEAALLRHGTPVSSVTFVIIAEAADEIERLRSERDDYKDAADSEAKEVNRLNDERTMTKCKTCHGQGYVIASHTRIRQIAGMPDAEGHCHASRDGDCDWSGCPQLRDGEPHKSGRHCPLDKDDEGEEGR